MKRIFPSLIAILCTLPMSVKAQMPRITSYDGGLDAFRKIRKEVYDTAKIAVYYDLKYLKDSTKTDKYTEAKTLLQISDKYTKYGDYYQLALDSMDIYMGKSKKNARDRQAIKTWNEAIGRINYYTVSITDLADYQTKVQFYDNLYNFEYSFTPQIDWNLAAGDTIISDIPCKKATCCYAGRDYVAWYADNISLPYGPYIFNGLPGLIIDIRDTKGNWIFTYAGMEKAHSYRDMYLYEKEFWGKLKTVSREEALTSCCNDIENYDNLSIEVFKVKTKVNGKWVSQEANYPRRPSNMLELKW